MPRPFRRATLPAAAQHLALPSRAAALRAVALLPALFFLVAILMPPLNHDVAAVLDFAQRWLDGATLYVDLVDVNPPLVFVLNLVPAALARVVGAPAALLACLLGFAAALWAMARALARGRAAGPVEAAVLAAGVPLLLLLAGSDFGQREVLMAMATIPYALLAARRIEGPAPPRRLALAVAITAAMAYALKPHFLVVPLLIEGLVLLRRGPRAVLADPVPRAMAAAWLLYAAAIPLFFPAYLAQVVPMAWPFYGAIHGEGPWRVLVADVMGSAEALLLLALPLALHPRAGALAQALGLAAAGAFVSAWVQHKGWTYHVLPMTILGLGALMAAGARWLDEALPAQRAARAAPGIAAVAAFAVLAFALRGGETPWRQLAFGQDAAGRLTAWLRAEAAGAPVLVLSPDIFPVYPALTYAAARPTLRTMSIWPLQGFYRDCPEGAAPYRDAAAMAPAERAFREAATQDFLARPPAAVMVARHANMPACGDRFDLLDYFRRDPHFDAAFARYRPAGELDGYRLFRRT
jgi:hypothetical protein